jgi:regulator of protease activity HflC (stomatin/prohibitin superfamily)
MTATQARVNREQVVRVQNGWMMLVLILVILAADVFSLAVLRVTGPARVLAIVLLPVIVVLVSGFFTLQPNEARVLVLFGHYTGTVRESGFHWGNPFYSNGAVGAALQGKGHAAAAAQKPAERRPGRNKISLRARTLNGERLKVNDKRGNPIEIAAVVVWRIEDTAQATFDVDDYASYVATQSESALRHLATRYFYDDGENEGGEITLRSNVEEVSLALGSELDARLTKAGVVVDEARLTHLAYAPEIAQAMLRRQQAEAVIAARQKIVHGAVSMVQMALKELAERDVVQLDTERRAAMVSNLMVVLCGESEVQPIVNTGTLYN